MLEKPRSQELDEELDEGWRSCSILPLQYQGAWHCWYFYFIFSPLIGRPNLIIVLICQCMIADQDFYSAALAEIVREGYPDHTAFDPKSEYYDEKSTKEDPRWFEVPLLEEEVARDGEQVHVPAHQAPVRHRDRMR